MVDSKLGVDGIEHRRFADGPIVSRDEISRGSQCRHGHPRRGRQPRHDHASVKAATRPSPTSAPCENDRVPQTPLGELADASTLFSAVAAAADALYVVDPEGRIRFLNPAALTILGYKDERQLLGLPSHDTTVGTRPLC